MIQGVAHQLFLQFVARIKAQLEAAPAPAGAEGSAATAAGATAAPATPAEPPPLRILPIILKVVWEGFVNFFRRLTGRSAGPR